MCAYRCLYIASRFVVLVVTTLFTNVVRDKKK